jgi:ketosteroid isomerase-like protein
MISSARRSIRGNRPVADRADGAARGRRAGVLDAVRLRRLHGVEHDRDQHTAGDAFHRDADGNYFFADRIKDAIRRRGENISSYELEVVVATHPAVREVAAVAVSSPVGEDDVLVVTPYCAILTFRDGLIVRDESYLDLRVWPSPGLSRAEWSLSVLSR